MDKSTDRKGPPYSHIDPALWERFAGAGSREEYCRSWLALQCSIIPDTFQGLVLVGGPGEDSFALVARWPEEGADPERLSEISERVIEERCGMLMELGGLFSDGPDHGPRYGVAYPVFLQDHLCGAVAIEVSADTEDRLKLVMEHLQWGVSWVELMFRRRQVRENENLLARLRSGVDLLAVALSEPSFEGAAMAFVTELATQLHCDRVSLAFVKNRHARVKAVSHSAQVGTRMNLIRAIEAAMGEAVVQRREILYPPPEGDTYIIRDHEHLTKQHGSGAILTIPFYREDRYQGALTLERPAWLRFEEDEAAFCRSVSSLIFPALKIKEQNDRVLPLKIIDSFKLQVSRILGPGYLGRKLAAICTIAVVLFFTYKTGEYRIAADASLEGAVRRVVAAPFEGYVKEAPVRAGDLVRKGDLMCTLDDRDLRLERLNWVSKRTQYSRQYQEALAEHDRAEAKIIKAQLDQAAAQLELVESRLERSRVIAPFDGLVLSGDMSRRLGGSVNKGEALFEVAPLNSYRVILLVDEHDIADVQKGLKGTMIVSSLPSDKYDFVIERITPVTVAEEGGNFFRVEAELDQASERLRPGMQGVGKIHVGSRKLISIWTRDLFRWLKLRLWSWWP